MRRFASNSSKSSGIGKFSKTCVEEQPNTSEKTDRIQEKLNLNKQEFSSLSQNNDQLNHSEIVPAVSIEKYLLLLVTGYKENERIKLRR